MSLLGWFIIIYLIGFVATLLILSFIIGFGEHYDVRETVLPSAILWPIGIPVSLVILLVLGICALGETTGRYISKKLG